MPWSNQRNLDILRVIRVMQTLISTVTKEPHSVAVAFVAPIRIVFTLTNSRIPSSLSSRP